MERNRITQSVPLNPFNLGQAVASRRKKSDAEIERKVKARKAAKKARKVNR